MNLDNRFYTNHKQLHANANKHNILISLIIFATVKMAKWLKSGIPRPGVHGSQPLVALRSSQLNTISGQVTRYPD